MLHIIKTSFDFSQFDYRFLSCKNYYKISKLSNLAYKETFWYVCSFRNFSYTI
ncbi:hypothetical protein NEOC65_001807 [Neochlamydia sp. AcF65]|nr:hypothetical protein [Neochlamydia sp. AcF65]MBS4171495.1 hypothetical protein [Neochlamydia sp. AcF95]